jgi:hypothetical protein
VDAPVVVGSPTPEVGAVVVSVVRVVVVWFMLSVVCGKTMVGVGMIRPPRTWFICSSSGYFGSECCGATMTK